MSLQTLPSYINAKGLDRQSHLRWDQKSCRFDLGFTGPIYISKETNELAIRIHTVTTFWNPQNGGSGQEKASRYHSVLESRLYNVKERLQETTESKANKRDIYMSCSCHSTEKTFEEPQRQITKRLYGICEAIKQKK